ncbi:syndecan [Pseudomyrmex gracilis]|uniref:syndecan n=1 Tax=Pseudomyrmex gracilis TaxID=219809 RepID=UPI0009954EEA|nr:syndecan [Pseudomyrmex gracilis]
MFHGVHLRIRADRAVVANGTHRHYGRKMPLRIHWILISMAVVILAGFNAATEKTEQSDKQQRTSASSTYNTFDDLYLDDQDALEGSGRGGTDNRDDLEASGSGLGPDDEDGDDDHEYTGNNGLEVPSKPTEARTPYFEDTNAKTKPQTTVDVNRGSAPDVNEPPGTEDDHADNSDEIREVYIMNPKHEDRASSFFAQPGVLAAVIGGAVVGLLCAILVVMFIVYRMRKKDEGSYALDEPRRSPAAQAFPKPGAPHHNREFYA